MVLQSANKNERLSFTETDKFFLLKLARTSISNYLNKIEEPSFNEASLSPTLMVKAGAFVSLKHSDKLRGCIGKMESDLPLWKSVSEIALCSAISDYRFDPITRDELEEVHIEISVITPMTKIKDYQQIELGKHGVYLKKGAHCGTFLPQVGQDQNWNLEEFLGNLSKNKANLEWNGWKNADLYIYEAIIFSDETMD
jgi:hypothetical protein